MILDSMVGGGPASSNDPSEVSLTPAWRSIATDLVILPTGAILPPETRTDIEAIRRNAYEQMQVFRRLAPPPLGGQYLNEVSYASYGHV